MRVVLGNFGTLESPGSASRPRRSRWKRGAVASAAEDASHIIERLRPEAEMVTLRYKRPQDRHRVTEIVKTVTKVGSEAFSGRSSCSGLVGVVERKPGGPRSWSPFGLLDLDHQHGQLARSNVQDFVLLGLHVVA